jgi:hypothetical protein
MSGNVSLRPEAEESNKAACPARASFERHRVPGRFAARPTSLHHGGTSNVAADAFPRAARYSEQTRRATERRDGRPPAGVPGALRSGTAHAQRGGLAGGSAWCPRRRRRTTRRRSQLLFQSGVLFVASLARSRLAGGWPCRRTRRPGLDGIQITVLVDGISFTVHSGQRGPFDPQPMARIHPIRPPTKRTGLRGSSPRLLVEPSSRGAASPVSGELPIRACTGQSSIHRPQIGCIVFLLLKNAGLLSLLVPEDSMHDCPLRMSHFSLKQRRSSKKAPRQPTLKFRRRRHRRRSLRRSAPRHGADTPGDDGPPHHKSARPHSFQET